MLVLSAETGENLVIRTCVLEDMNNQCGQFKFQNATMRGCILTCDRDGCNSAPAAHHFHTLALAGRESRGAGIRSGSN